MAAAECFFHGCPCSALEAEACQSSKVRTHSFRFTAGLAVRTIEDSSNSSSSPALRLSLWRIANGMVIYPFDVSVALIGIKVGAEGKTFNFDSMHLCPKDWMVFSDQPKAPLKREGTTDVHLPQSGSATRGESHAAKQSYGAFLVSAEGGGGFGVRVNQRCGVSLTNSS